MGEADVHWWSAVEAGRRLASGELSAVELTTSILSRIDSLDGALGAFAEVTADRAMVSAERADNESRAGRHRGPLHGVPVAVKALCDIAGVRTAAGTEVLAEHVPATDATVVSRLEEAGAVLVGSLTMTEGASAVHHPSIEPPRNPWDPQAWAGASSSGSGVATAAGLCFGSLGSDTAGSIRAPSHFCGVVGLKPTYGRVSRAGVFPLSATLDHVGPMTRTVADCAAMLGVLAGPDERDPSARQIPVPDYLRELDQPLRGLRIGYDEHYSSDGVAPELAAAVREAMAVLEGAGALVEPIVVPPREPALEAGALIVHSDVAHAHDPYFEQNKDRYGPHLREMIESGLGLSAADVARGHELRRQWTGQLEALYESVDVIVCPPTVAPAPPAHLTTALSPDFFTQGRFFGFTMPFTVSGNPSLTVPCGFTTTGLPMAVQLVGRHFDESRLLQAGHAYQRETNWHNRHPF